MLPKTPIYIIFFKVIWKCLKKIKDYWYFFKLNKINSSPMSDYFFIKNFSFFDTVNRKKLKEIDLLKNLVAKEIIDNRLLNNLSNLEDKEFINQNIKKKEKIINFANLYCLHNFDLLGSGEVNVSYNTKAKGVEDNVYEMNPGSSQILKVVKRINSRVLSIFSDLSYNDFNFLKEYKYKPIDWQLDFKSGYRWNNKEWYRKISYGNNRGADIKVPWELSRSYHLLTLGQAYWLTGDEKYTREFIYQITDWIENNPPRFGVNWACTMDVAVRICNWILGFLYFKNSGLINNKFLFYFSKNIFIHGLHIRNNLEKELFSVKTNHYLSDIAGLLYIGIFFDNTSFGKKWSNFAIAELKEQMKNQVYPDGSNFEASTYYHRLVTELFFYSTLLVIKNSSDFKSDNYIEVGEKIFNKQYMEKLYKMFEVILFILKPNGSAVQIGDNDNGRLHVYGKKEVLDVRYLLNLACVLFRDPKFKIKEFGSPEEIIWIFGRKGNEYWNRIKGSGLDNIYSRAFPDAGWYIMRDKKNYMIISSGPNGQNGNGGHAHNDKLNFELCINGEDIIVDAGSYLYTPLPEYRNKFRSTVFHNTIVVDNEEQNRFSEKSLFFLENDAKVKVNLWKSTEKCDFLDAEHYGYQRLKNPVIHRRQIVFNKKNSYWVIKDILAGAGEHLFELYFHLANGVGYKIDDDSLIVDINTRNGLNFKIYPLQRNDIKFSVEDGWVSYGYGEKEPSTVLKYSKAAAVPIEFLFIFTFKDFVYSKEYVKKMIDELNIS